MKVLHQIISFLPHLGGGEVVTYEIAKYLLKGKNEQYVFTPFIDEYFAKISPFPLKPFNYIKNYEIIDGIKVIRFKVPKLFPITWKTLPFFSIKPSLEAIISTDPDIITCDGPFIIPCIISGKLLKKKTVFHIHGSLEFKGKYSNKILKKIIFNAINCFDKIIVLNISSVTLSNIKKIVKDRRKIEIIFNWVDTKRFRPRKKKYEEKIKLLTVCRLDKNMNIEKVLCALKRIKEDFELKIVGDGPEKNRLLLLTKKLGLEKKVKFLGFIDFREKTYPKIFSDSDIFILLKNAPGVPKAYLEAFASGIPVIGQKKGLPSFFLDYKLGKFIEPRINEIRSSITQLIKEDPKNYKKNVIEFVKKFFDKEKQLKRIENVYKELVMCD